MYAIVDIETTGSPVKDNGITEIAIVLYDGKNIEGKYQTLINPKVGISQFVAKLTGISNDMVAAAPEFSEVAENIFRLLEGRIFVAHNAGFDFPYVSHFLKASGFYLNSKVLCTLNLSRRAFPNLPKHGLEFLCSSLKIDNHSRHRAGGDAMATTELLGIILNNGGERLVKSMIQNGI
ncbi:3'-5' exonuclease [Arachidicoccus ginsenosidimutans]|uniref:3'-5' exonuclease n=1 Tax=Arachidicoccus sp. BS20 TaxID=1850526 RepID=UPI0018D44348|nr:3'-5' exonuclease [Arachidicoccus sp. BS20]